MKAMQLARELAQESFWAAQPRKVLILAARFYSGVDNLDQLRHMAEPAISSTHHGYEHCIRPTLSHDQVEMIINMR